MELTEFQPFEDIQQLKDEELFRGRWPLGDEVVLDPLRESRKQLLAQIDRLLALGYRFMINGEKWVRAESPAAENATWTWMWKKWAYVFPLAVRVKLWPTHYISRQLTP